MKIFKKVLLSVFCILLVAVLLSGGILGFYYPHYKKAKPSISMDTSALSAGEIRIMSANVRCLNPQDLGKKSWFYRADLILKNIEAEAPTVIGFQEVTKWQYAYLCDTLSGYDSVITYRDDTLYSEGCPVFYNTSLYNLKDKGSFWLSETPEVMSKGWDAACYRICSYVILEEKENGKQFVVFNTHLDHVSDTARINGIRVVLDKIAQFGGLPSVIIGDLNAAEDSETYRSVTENFLDAKYQLENPQISATYQNWGTELDRPCIDYCMISKTGFTVNSYKVVQTTYDGVYPSDHFPLSVSLTLTEE
ncbi:MAG: endonuclease/exonuclease/phosphatase family protein [Ruminococcus sp.]|nr:endonuclease/exonuclease/phosphatase family protein [Ruminococcus sp.]